MPVRWGDWIIARSRAIGYRRQIDLALSVGCSKDQMSRWAQLQKPPGRITKGFDKALASALKVSVETLFRNWQNVVPDEIPKLMMSRDHVWPKSDGNFWTFDPVRTAKQMIEVLEPDELDRVVRFIRFEIDSKGGERAERFARIGSFPATDEELSLLHKQKVRPPKKR